jgi:hypothetical protein
MSVTVARPIERSSQPSVSMIEAVLCLGPDCRRVVLVGTGWDGFCDVCADLLIVHDAHAEAPHDECPGCTHDLRW